MYPYIDLLTILAGGILAGELYAAYLKPRQHLYNPHWTWLTVIGGVVLSWLVFAALAWRGYVSWPAAGWFVVVFCATAIGILRWQLGQVVEHLREQMEERRNGPEDPRRG